MSLQFALYGSLMFTLGMLIQYYVFSTWVRGILRKSSKDPDAEEGGDKGEASRDEIRSELMRDPFATDLMCSDDTPDDVVRYLYLEAEQRVKLRKQGLLGEHENDLFAAPKHMPYHRRLDGDPPEQSDST